MQASETVRTSVIIGLGSKLQVMQAQLVRSITSYDEIDLELPGKQKCAYYCIVSDQDNTFEFLSSLFFSFLFIRLIRYADAYGKGGVLDTKVKFILDEFPNACTILDFTKKCSTIRSRGVSVAVFFRTLVRCGTDIQTISGKRSWDHVIPQSSSAVRTCSLQITSASVLVQHP